MAKVKFELDTNSLMKKVKKITTEHVNTLTVDAKCPHCDKSITVTSGINVCPFCNDKIDVNFDINFTG